MRRYSINDYGSPNIPSLVHEQLFGRIVALETRLAAVESAFGLTQNLAQTAYDLALGGGGLPTLGPLTLTPDSFTEDASFVSTIGGKTPGSTVTASASDGTPLTVTGATLSGTFPNAGTFDITLTEDYVGLTPYQTVLSSVVASAGGGVPTLGSLSLSTALTSGTSISGTILGATAGSSLALTPAVTGLAINSGARTFNFDGTGTAGTAVSITETLAGATGSPKANAVTTIAAAGATLGTLSLSGTLTNSTTSTGTITGATSGSSIASNVTGLSVNSGARTYSFDGSAIAGTTANGLVETLAGATNSPRSSAVVVAAAGAGTNPAVSRPAAYNPTYPINIMGDSTTFGTGAPSGSDTVTLTRAFFTGGSNQPFNLLGTATTVNALYAGNGGVGGENSAQGLARVQYVATNYAAQLDRTWSFSFGLNDYLPSVTPQTRQWADNVKANYASAVALIPAGRDYFFMLTPAEQNVGPGQQFSADHTFHRRDMISTYGWRSVALVRALRLIRQEDTSVPIISGGADEKALSMGIVAYSYRGTGLYGAVVGGTDYADGDRTPVIQTVAPSNTTDLGYDDGALWYVNTAAPVMYRKTGPNGAGGWAQSDPKHQGRVGYGKIARLRADIMDAIEGKVAFAPPTELRCPLDAAPGFVIGTVPIKGTVTAAGIYNLDGSPATQVSISTAGVVTRTGTGTILDGAAELVGALTHSSGTVSHFAIDLFGTRASGAAPTLRALASPGVSVVARANHGMSNTTGFSFAMYLSVTSLASGPTLLAFTRNSNLASSPTQPSTPINITLTTGGAPRFTVVDSTNATIANSLITSGASFTAGTPGWLFVSLDFTNNLRTVFVADAASERTGTVGAITAGTVPINDALPSFLIGAVPNQYYDGVSPLVGGIGYIGFWDSYVDWTIAANRRALASATGVPAVRTPYAALPSGPAPKLELFGSKGDWLYGTPDGSNGPQTLSISHRARTLMS